jgi:hydroxymethylpyrimidine/phosphomethylpyrimidine kinase
MEYPHSQTPPRILVIAGSDSGGGAGIQGDSRAITALGGFATTAITALTAQNTLGVQGIYDVSPKFVVQQITSVLEDIGADAIKSGMLHTAEVIHAVAGAIKPYTDTIPFVLDPVMVAKGGAALLESEALQALVKELLPQAFLVTPNIPEVELLSGMKVMNTETMIAAGKNIVALGARSCLVKGGHLEGGNTVEDVLVTPQSTKVYSHERIHTQNTHGTGCTLASAIATGLARKEPLEMAVEKGRIYVLQAIRNAPKIGHGHGPLGIGK